MKTFIAAMALVVALPAAANAQGAGHADPHAQHGGSHEQHKGMDHGKECCDHKTADGKPMNCCKGKEGKAHACCDKKDQKGHDAHAGHGMKH